MSKEETGRSGGGCLALCIAALLPAIAGAALPAPSGAVFEKGSRLTVSGYSGTTALSGFPVLVRIAEDLPKGFSYGDLRNAAGGKDDIDIGFTDADGNGLAYEIDTWNPSGESLVWVRLPSMTAGTQFMMCWGSESSGKALCRANAWSDYTGVWHLGETADGVTAVADSTANGLNGTTVETSESVADAPVGGARHVTKSDQHTPGIDSGITIDLSNAAKRAAVDGLGTEFCASMWVRATADFRYFYLIGRKSSDGYKAWGVETLNSSTSGEIRLYSAGASDSQNAKPKLTTALKGTGAWHKIDFVWKGDGTYVIYQDGANKLAGGLYGNAPAVQGSLNLSLGGALDNNGAKGGRGLNGDLDEVRLRAFAPGDDWAAADYATQADPAFLEYSEAEVLPTPSAPCGNVSSVSDLRPTSANVTANITWLGVGAASASVRLEVSTDGDDFSRPVVTMERTISATGETTFSVSGLETNTTYFVRAVIDNGQETLATEAVSFKTPFPVARVGAAEYVSLQDALDAADARAGTAVVLLADVDLPSPATVEGTVTLDLAGHAVRQSDSSVAYAFRVAGGSSLAIVDGSEDGSGAVAATGACGIYDLGGGSVRLAGGTLCTRCFRTQDAGEGSEILFDGATVKAAARRTDFLPAGANVQCVVGEGGLVVDTAGFDVTVEHDLSGSGPLVKKGEGTLTVTGANPFGSENIFVYAGSVVIGGTTYKAQTILDGSAGGWLGEMTLHGDALEGWLKDPDFTTYTSKYGARGVAMLEQPKSVTVCVGGKFKTYENLEVGITTNDTFNGVSYSFSTESLPPRTMKVISTVDDDPVENVRDVGSWPLVSVDGTAKMRQGVIYRGGHLDNFLNATDAQKATSAVAGIRTEIDLRHQDSDTIPPAYAASEKSWAAVDADYLPCPLNWRIGGMQIDTKDASFTNQVRRVFARLGTPGALPAYFHCRIGTDRTGIMGLLLLGLMGVEEETLYRDYLMSNFANIEGSRSPDVPETFLGHIHRGHCNSRKYVYRDNGYGLSVAARCRAYLEMAGVAYDEIANITMALSGETPEQVLARVDAYEAANGCRTVSYVPWQGSSTTNAMHRLPAGKHMLPISRPVRDYYTFLGWDTDGEADNGDGTSAVYGLWERNGYMRFWADGNGASESFARYASWDPAPDAGTGFMAGDTLVLNKGADGKVAVLDDGDSVTVRDVHVGWGRLSETGSVNANNDKGGRLDVKGGLLTVTNVLNIGYSCSDYSNNVVNVTGGRVEAAVLHMGDSSSNGGQKSDTLNISGAGVVQAGTSGDTRLAVYKAGLARVNVTDGGTFVGRRRVDIGYAGKAYFLLDGGTVDVGANAVNIGCGKNSSSGLCHGVLTISNGTWTAGAMNVGNSDSASVTGEVRVAGGALNAASVCVGASKGTGLLALDGGRVNAGKVTSSAATAQTVNWNGGTLSCNGAAGNATFFPANASIALNVLEGGAVYETAEGRETESVEIAQPMAGVGAFVKRGGGTLSLTGAVDIRGGFKVEGGALNVGSVLNGVFGEVAVGAGCTLRFAGEEKAAVTAAKVRGSGTVVNADLVVTGTIEPGLATDGKVTFAQGAAFDFTGISGLTAGGTKVLLTAAEFANAPSAATFGRWKVDISQMENEDGTRSLVGAFAPLPSGVMIIISGGR